MPDLAVILSDVPMALRVVVGLIGGLLIVAGARWYDFGLGLGAFGAGSALVASGLSWVGV